jgi:outer membrane lipoprotein SlyB
MNKFRVSTLAVAASAMVLTGCQYPNGQPNNTGTGALIGAGSGALLGAALGGRNAAAGALIGGLFGAIGGSIIGNQIDQAQAAQLQAQAPVTYVRVQQNQPLTVADVQALVNAKVSDDVIIAQIQNSHSIFHLSPQDIISLHNSGASDRLVNFMINTPNTVAPAPPPLVVASDSPPPPPAQPVMVAPGPGYVWTPGQWQWNGAGWVWVSGQWVYPPWPNAVWVGGYWYRGPFGGWRYAPGHWR